MLILLELITKKGTTHVPDTKEYKLHDFARGVPFLQETFHCHQFSQIFCLNAAPEKHNP
jgi:hypothetical protein